MEGSWIWIGVGAGLTVLLIITLFCLCRMFHIFKTDKISFLKYAVRRRRINSVSVTVQMELEDDVTKANLSQTSVNPNLFYQPPEKNDKQDYHSITMDKHQSRTFHYLRASSVTPSQNGKRSRSEQISPIRSVSRILWEDLTVMATEEVSYTGAKYDIEQKQGTIIEKWESTKYFEASRKFHRLAWGKNPVKILLFAKLLSGYFTVNSYERLCKVNDWRHVSGNDLHYREKAIFELVCQNQLQIEV